MRTITFFALTLFSSALLAGISCSSSSTPVGPTDAGEAGDAGKDASKEAAPDVEEDAGNLCPDAYFPPATCMPAVAKTCDGGCCLGSACFPVPSYSTDIVPILHARCSPCHFEGGIEDFGGPGGLPLTSWASVDNADIAIQNQVARCLMPPIDGIHTKMIHVDAAAPLSSAQRATLLDWLACGAPNN
jgi:hypothetical protein